METLSEYFPFWKELTGEQKNTLTDCARTKEYKKGDMIHEGGSDCTGLVIVRSGQLRAWLLSEGGKEVTLYRLFERDICLFSASCVLQDIQFEVMVSAMEDTRAFVIPAGVWQKLTQESLAASRFTNQLMASRFSDVMWLIEQILFHGFDRRLAQFLTEQAALEGGNTVTMTHGEIAGHLGTAREVVSRMLKYFQSEGYVGVQRGVIRILEPEWLRKR